MTSYTAPLNTAASARLTLNDSDRPSNVLLRTVCVVEYTLTEAVPAPSPGAPSMNDPETAAGITVYLPRSRMNLRQVRIVEV